MQAIATWLNTHAVIAGEVLRKPILVEEFGKKVAQDASAAGIRDKRDPIYRSVYASVERSVER